jgi:mono/diheme cytochrome c family protein
MKPLTAAVCFLSLVFTAARCGTARRTEPVAGPLPESSTEVARGEMVFMRHCQECHTFGERSFAPALNNKPAPGWLMKLQVRVGLGAMPSFSKEQIPPRDLDAIVAYLKALRSHTGGLENGSRPPADEKRARDGR